ncbi:MAG: hypothetical protein HOH19_14375 [Kordiimonadaceae bacterium]|mgnify:CR=1 FL=1|jgi:hypothetical protein|nr:hypothetical protein [Kordiimonadaceae bacterium]MBT6033757.1 hypothetical protein [Kordiimonadaceae bacterium]MBT7583338.1 hypothetical protein [Kordiimonadaceae bacterium]
MEIYLVVIVFLAPISLGLYLWRDKEPQRKLYLMIASVSLVSLIILVFAGSPFMTFMGLGLFLASTSFFSGVYLSGLVRAYKTRKED